MSGLSFLWNILTVSAFVPPDLDVHAAQSEESTPAVC